MMSNDPSHSHVTAVFRPSNLAPADKTSRHLRPLATTAVLLLMLLPASPSRAQEDAVTCADGVLLLGERSIPLPEPCAQIDSADGWTAVATTGGAVFLVDAGGSLHPVPTGGPVLRVGFVGRMLAVTERVDQVRLVDPMAVAAAASAPLEPAALAVEGADAVTSAAGGPDASSAATLPSSADEEPPAVVGTVVEVRGPRVFVEGPGVEQGPVPGDWIAVCRDAVARQEDPTTGRVVERGDPGNRSVIRVRGNDGTRLVAELGRGDRARVGDAVTTAPGMEPTEELVTPRAHRDLLMVGTQVIPAVSLADPGVAGFGRVWASYAFRFPMRVEVALRQGMLGVPSTGQTFARGAVDGTVSLDLPGFEIGLSVGWQQFNEQTTGVLLGHYLRWGFRDGFLFEVRTRFLLPPANVLGGIEGRVLIPMDRVASMTLSGGGGSSIGYGLVGVELRARGQGGHGTLLINPAVGFLLTEWWEDVEITANGETTIDTRYRQLAGPGLSLRVEYRP